MHIDLRKVIGKGVFGQVFLAEVEERNMSPMYKQLKHHGNKKEYDKCQRIRVAVKVIKGNTCLLILFSQGYNVGKYL